MLILLQIAQHSPSSPERIRLPLQNVSLTSLGSLRPVPNVVCLLYFLVTCLTIMPTVSSVVAAAQQSIAAELEPIQRLASTASEYPYYRFNYAWTRPMQDAVRCSPQIKEEK